MKRPINNPIQQFEVCEVCPECGAENIMTWNVETEGYVAYCPHCGSKMMLCDECLHADDAKVCDWCACRGCYRERNFVAYDEITGILIIEVRKSLNV